MSLFPYFLGELRDWSDTDDAPASPAPRRHYPRHDHHPYRRWGGDHADLMDDLLVLRDCARRPGLSSLMQLLGDGPRRLEARPRQLRRPSAALVKKPAKKTRGPAADDDLALAIDVDVQQFRPEELSVQVLRDQGVVVIEGHHEERPDEHGYVEHHFSRRYTIPDGVDPDAISSRISADGVLRVTAPGRDALPAPEDNNVRHVPIQQADRAALQNGVNGEDKKAEPKRAEKQAKGVDEEVHEVEV